MSNNELIIILLIVFNVNSLIIGYIFGRYTSSGGVYYNDKQSFSKRNESQIRKNNLCIDDKKVVVDIKTDGLEKKYDSLGDIKQSKENISNSVNKLKNLKR